MKMAAAKQAHYESGPNMTPLVDVVMVILIFLMLAGSFGTTEHFLASKTAIHAGGGGGPPPSPDWKPPTMLDVRVETNGDSSIVGGNARFTGAEGLRTALVEKKKQYDATGIKDVEVVLHPQEGTRWEALAPLYDAALRAEFEKVAFAMTGSK